MKVVLLMFACSFNSSFDTVNVYIEFVTKIVHIESKSGNVGINIQVRNNSQTNLLLYNIKAEPDQAFREESFFCNGEMAARPSIIVYNENMEVIYARPTRIPHDINYKPITRQDVDEAISLEKAKFKNILQVALAESTTGVWISANFKQFRLDPGVYFMKIVYSSGSYNLNMINQSEVDEDRLKYDAEMFNGCISSDTVRLIVD